MADVETVIREKLTAAFAPVHLAIENESHKHAHHREMQNGGPSVRPGETHFRVKIVAQAFSGKSRVERHRLIYATLAEVMNNPVHALAIAASTPGEDT